MRLGRAFWTLSALPALVIACATEPIVPTGGAMRGTMFPTP
jgi:hypothetical protein